MIWPGLLACIGLFLVIAATTARAETPAYVGSAVCADCHADADRKDHERGVARVFDHSAKSHDGKRAHDAERARDIVANHDRRQAQQHGEQHERRKQRPLRIFFAARDSIDASNKTAKEQCGDEAHDRNRGVEISVAYEGSA